jgi:hypothetical protein
LVFWQCRGRPLSVRNHVRSESYHGKGFKARAPEGRPTPNDNTESDSAFSTCWKNNSECLRGRCDLPLTLSDRRSPLLSSLGRTQVPSGACQRTISSASPHVLPFVTFDPIGHARAARSRQLPPSQIGTQDSLGLAQRQEG